MLRKLFAVVVVGGIGLGALGWARADRGLTATLEWGSPEFQSIGAITFGPENILFFGDTHGAAVFAVDVADGKVDYGSDPLSVDGIDKKIAGMLGTTPSEITIHDLAVHPASQNIYLSVSRGSDALLMRVTKSGKVEEVSLSRVKFSKAEISDAPASDAMVRRRPARTYTVTDLAFLNGEVYVAGLSNEEFASHFRRIPFPFTGSMKSTGLEIYHVSHHQDETHAPVQTFAPVEIGGEMKVLAAYTCTPLVQFSVENLEDGAHVVGTTVAELGAGNRPLDIVPYEWNGESKILIANSRHPLMKMNVADFAGAQKLSYPTREAGVSFQNLTPPGVVQLADLNKDHVVALQRNGDSYDLRSLAKSTF